MTEKLNTTVYYNSACPVCDAGIDAQKAKMHGCNIDWVDVHNNPGAASDLGTDLESIRERLHVKDKEGHIWVGATALSVIWGMTPGQRLLGRISGWPVVAGVLALAYNAFAKLLYQWNRWKKHW